MAYNRREYLSHAVRSALSQTLPRNLYEVVVTKNFDTPEDEHWRTEGVKLVKFDERSLGRRIAHALAFCRGEFVAFLDDDDFWAPAKLERIYDAWKENPDAAYFYNERIDVDVNGAPLKQQSTVDWHRYGWNSSSVTIRRSLLEANVGYLAALNMTTDTFCFFAALASLLPMVYIRERLTHYRIPPSGLYKPERRSVHWADMGVILEMVEASPRALARFNEMVTFYGTYWSLARKLRSGERLGLREYIRFTLLAAAFVTGFKRWALITSGLVSPGLYRRLNPGA